MRKQFPDNIRRITATIGERTYCYRSEGEFMWVQYLEWLKKAGEIKDWRYEITTFFFPNEKTAPVQYTPDFFIVPTEGPAYYQELKRGHLDGSAVTKFRRMAKHCPDEIIELVMLGKPKKDNHRMHIAKKYVRRIVDATVIIRQLGRLIITAKDFRLLGEPPL